MAAVLICSAEVWQQGLCDLRIVNGKVAELGQLQPRPGEQIIEAGGGALLPGLHDHHIHLTASAARAESLICGPPEVTSASQLAGVLSALGSGWLRGILYHESVMGLPDAAELDALAPHRPVRIQHRSGRLWLLNSRALDLLLEHAEPPPGLERDGGHYTGRLFDEDEWLRRAMGSSPPGLAQVSAQLTRYGVTGVTDMTPRNDAATAIQFTNEIVSGRLQQWCVMAGKLELADAVTHPQLQIGPAKLHLHENAMPDLDETIAFIRSAHDHGRPLASHCTTETELVFTLAALEAAGVLAGDRIEHAGIAADHHIAEIARLGLAVVSQPHFIAERGDQYLQYVEPRLHYALYRLAAFCDAGIVLAAGSDAPFGSLDPWAAMAAAISRRTQGGAIIGEAEALSPEQALALFLADPLNLARQRVIATGGPADLCLLDRPWQQARNALSSALASALVHATLIGGTIVHQRIDQPPIQRLPG